MNRIKYEIKKTFIGFMPLASAILALLLSVAYTELMRLI